MHRRQWLLGCLLLVGIGCGGVKGVAFGTKTKGYLDQLKVAVDAKDAAQVQRLADTAERVFKGANMQPEEYKFIKQVADLAKEGKWEDAAKAVEASIEYTKRAG